MRNRVVKLVYFLWNDISIIYIQRKVWRYQRGNQEQNQIVFIIFQPHESYLSLNIIIFTDIQITAWVVEWSSLLTSDHKQDIIYVFTHFDTYLQC